MKSRFFPPRIGDPLFTSRKLAALLIPLVAEQVLTQTIGLIGTIMVAQVGEHVLSGVSLVDTINSIALSLFISLSMGGTIITSQFIGRQEIKSASESANQLIIVTTGIAAVCGVVSLIFRIQILDFIYDVEQSVMDSADTYFLITSCSFPFMALFSSASSIFRATGNARLPLYVSIIMNIINVGCCALFIFVMRLGAAGPALGALTSRMAGSIIVAAKLSDKKLEINISDIFPLRLNIPMVRNILMIGIPSGIENSMMTFGRLLNSSIVSSFGTAAIAAASIGNHINVITLMPGTAISNALLTVVGQCVGAGKYDQARRYTTSFVLMAMGTMVLLNMLCLAFMKDLIAIFNASEETARLSERVILILIFSTCIFAPFSFTLPNALRAANDVSFTLILSLVCMFPVRVFMGYVLSFHTPVGEMGIWYALVMDWGFKAILCVVRFAGNRWTRHKILKGTTAEST